jgi:hypothetical protein
MASHAPSTSKIKEKEKKRKEKEGKGKEDTGKWYPNLIVVLIDGG